MTIELRRVIIDLYQSAAIEVDVADLHVEFDRISGRIEADYELRRRQQKGQRRDGARGWLLQASYTLLSAVVLEDECELLYDRIEAHGRYPLGVPEKLNPFQLGLMAIFAHTVNGIRPQDREWIGKRQWHAYRHYIPPVLIRGFLRQIEARGLENRAIRGAVEAGFEQWVISAALHDRSGFKRGPYQPRIQEVIDRLRADRRRRVARQQFHDADLEDEDQDKDILLE